MSPAQSSARIGIIGLGIMGKAYARNLIEAGHVVCGYDVSEDAMAAVERLGGRPCADPAEVARQSDVILLALASAAALEEVVSGPNGLREGLNRGAVVCETGTLPIDLKQSIRETLARHDATLLDCPVSGTGAQAAMRDLVIYASGDQASVDRVRPVLEAMARNVLYVGSFGAGMKLKYVANLLVTIHNLAAAEALLLAERSGLDLDLVFQAISDGAGTSRMFEVRGPLMIEERYEPATMKFDVFMKDIALIENHAGEAGCPTPLFSACVPLYAQALAQGRAKQDTAALFATLKNMSTAQA